MSIGEKIKKYRKENNITQKELAKAIGIGRSTLAEMESGKIKGKMSNIKRISAVTKTPLTYWTDEEDIEVAPYDVLDSFLDILIKENFIREDGKIPDEFKDSLLSILEKEIKLKICREKL